MENLTTDTFEDGGKMEIDVHDLIGNVPDFRSYHRTFFLDHKKRTQVFEVLNWLNLKLSSYLEFNLEPDLEWSVLSRNAPKFYFLFSKSLEASFLLFILISRNDIIFIESD